MTLLFFTGNPSIQSPFFTFNERNFHVNIANVTHATESQGRTRGGTIS